MAEADVKQHYVTRLGLKVKRLQPAIGAEISGVDLRQALSPDLIQELREVLLAHGVIGFRDQDITREQMIRLGRAFGELVVDHGDTREYPEIQTIRSSAGAKDQSASRWHSDGCYMEIPPAFTMLKAVQAGGLGGDTSFSSAVAAYEGLSDEMKARIANLRYISDMAFMLRRAGKRTQAFGTDEKWRALAEKYPAVEQPVVRVHPETGKPALYVNSAQSFGIVGMEPAEAQELLRTLFDEFKRPEYQVRWHWEPNSLVVWDNRAVQHYGVPNQQYDRVMDRLTVIGARPYGLDGRETSFHKGEAQLVG